MRIRQEISLQVENWHLKPEPKRYEAEATHIVCLIATAGSPENPCKLLHPTAEATFYPTVVCCMGLVRPHGHEEDELDELLLLLRPSLDGGSQAASSSQLPADGSSALHLAFARALTLGAALLAAAPNFAFAFAFASALPVALAPVFALGLALGAKLLICWNVGWRRISDLLSFNDTCRRNVLGQQRHFDMVTLSFKFWGLVAPVGQCNETALLCFKRISTKADKLLAARRSVQTMIAATCLNAAAVRRR